MTGKGPEPGARNTYRLSTPRVVLETPTTEDATTLYELAGGEHRSEVIAGLVWDGPDDVSQMLAFIQQSQLEPFDEYGFHWAIRDRTGALTGEPETAMGMIATRPRGEPGRGDVGYWLGRPYWGHGVMSESLRALLDLCFGELDMVKIEADVFTTNIRSIRLVERLGMTLEGTIRRAHFKGGVWVDAHLYGLLREEWPAVTPDSLTSS